VVIYTAPGTRPSCRYPSKQGQADALEPHRPRSRPLRSRYRAKVIGNQESRRSSPAPKSAPGENLIYSIKRRLLHQLVNHHLD
jgi:hypothetical protein